MIRAFNKLLTTDRYKNNFIKLLTNEATDVTDIFGVGSKFVGLDSKRKKQVFSTENLQPKTSSFKKSHIDDPDQFGTITNEYKSM